LHEEKEEVCAQCEWFPCSKFESWLIGWQKIRPLLGHKRAHSNLNFMREHDLERFVELGTAD
jgi:hypothetical protein